VTAPKSSASPLQQQLKAAGMGVSEVGLRGSFHNKRHREDVELLVQFCNSHSAFQFPDAAELVFPTRSNTGGDYVSGKLHHMVLRSMLEEQTNWHQAFAALQSSTLTSESLIVSFGRERCVPPSLMRKLGPQLIQVADLDLASARLPASLLHPQGRLKSKGDLFPEDSIAVLGMSCELPGAADLEGFWDILCAGKSQHIEAPAERFNFQTAWRDADTKRTWYGNFIEHHDTFDHKFFKKSPREMASTDPQHQLMLQVAYQAVEQSGYFNAPPQTQDKHIRCYIGVGLVDYENNIACHQANAYSATGNLKAFAAGKISHYFGWTGPGLTIDTACSSSAVVVHQACKAILAGECSAALAGGVNVMTSPEWFQNLAEASFLSPTGQCKPFDVNADGYCRAEGVGAVFLKKLSSAIADGGQILGVIAASAVYQNENCTPITVPNAKSLSGLFGDVTRRAGLQPKQISVVEAHGTSTPVGDPAEYDSVRRVFRGSIRTNTLSLGSVKGLLGHTESSSGIVALIKTLLLIVKGAIPPQASFQTINSSINASPSDNREITTRLKSWDVDFRDALINNYGASGSNASLIVTQAPYSKALIEDLTELSGTKYPFWLCGLDEQSLRVYSARLVKFLKLNKPSLVNLSFQVSHQSNRSLGYALIFSCSSVNELEEKLRAFATGQKSISATPRQQPPRPVILCFGGQVSTFVGLDLDIFENISILRNHLDQCNDICQSLGLESIYPGIFQRTPIGNVVKLLTILFALQHACAKFWIDCGVQIVAVVGHSFGELSAFPVFCRSPTP
jgi:acyl transferase domain-containing protein